MKSVLDAKVRELDPLKPMLGEFAIRWEWISDPQQSTLQANSSVDDDQAMLSNQSAKKLAWSAMTDRAIAAKSLFAGSHLDPAERLRRADKLESNAESAGLSPGTVEVFISAHANLWAQRVVSDRLRIAGLRAMIEALYRRSKGDQSWDKPETLDPLTGKPVKLTRAGDTFSIVVGSDSLNTSLTSPDSMVQALKLDWPYRPAKAVNSRQPFGGLRTGP